MFIDRKIIKLLVNFFINISSSYFIAALILPSTHRFNVGFFLNLFSNIFLAIMYFGLSVNISKHNNG